MLDISSVCLRNQDPSASAPESSDFGGRCILQLQAAPERTTAFEAYGVWFARVVHSTPEQLGASGRFLAFYPFLAGCGGLARRLCGHQIEFGASLSLRPVMAPLLRVPGICHAARACGGPWGRVVDPDGLLGKAPGAGPCEVVSVAAALRLAGWLLG